MVERGHRNPWRRKSPVFVWRFRASALDGRAGYIRIAILRMIRSVAFPRTARERALAAVFAMGAFAAGIAPVADGDLWWHLAAGREGVRTHSFLRVDPFSVTAGGGLGGGGVLCLLRSARRGLLPCARAPQCVA